MIEELKIRLKEMKQTPNASVDYALCVSDMEFLLSSLEKAERRKHDCDLVEEHVNALEDIINKQEKIIKSIAAIHKMEANEDAEYPNLIESVEQTFLVTEELQKENKQLQNTIKCLKRIARRRYNKNKAKNIEILNLQRTISKLSTRSKLNEKLVEASKHVVNEMYPLIERGNEAMELLQTALKEFEKGENKCQ